MGKSDVGPEEEPQVGSTAPPEDEPGEDARKEIIGSTMEIRRLRELLEHLSLNQYVRALLNTRRIAWISLLSGIMSGLGAVIGATLGLAILVYVLTRLEVIPYLGGFIAEVVRIVKHKM